MIKEFEETFKNIFKVMKKKYIYSIYQTLTKLMFIEYAKTVAVVVPNNWRSIFFTSLFSQHSFLIRLPVEKVCFRSITCLIFT